MSDIFISYKSEDRPRVGKLAHALESEGWSVWWDEQIRLGERYDRRIEDALSNARCVLVVWSQRSVGSDWVRNEAANGLRRGILVAVALDGIVGLPLEFTHIHTQTLAGWNGSHKSPEYANVVSSIRHVLEQDEDKHPPSAPIGNPTASHRPSFGWAIAAGFLVLLGVAYVLAARQGQDQIRHMAGGASPQQSAPAPPSTPPLAGLANSGDAAPPTPAGTSHRKEKPRTRPNGSEQVTTSPLPGTSGSVNQSAANPRLLPWPQSASVRILTPETGRDFWITSVYSNLPGPSRGPGGGLDNEFLRVGGSGDSYHTLLAFQLSGLPKRAASAAIYLYAIPTENSRATPVSMYLDRIVTPWAWAPGEHLWWAKRPRTELLIASPLPPPQANAWYRIEVTDVYNAWQAGTYPNHGLQLRPTATNNRFNTFVSSNDLQSSALRPALVVQ